MRLQSWEKKIIGAWFKYRRTIFRAVFPFNVPCTLIKQLAPVSFMPRSGSVSIIRRMVMFLWCRYVKTPLFIVYHSCIVLPVITSTGLYPHYISIVKYRWKKNIVVQPSFHIVVDESCVLESVSQISLFSRVCKSVMLYVCLSIFNLRFHIIFLWMNISHCTALPRSDDRSSNCFTRLTWRTVWELVDSWWSNISAITFWSYCSFRIKQILSVYIRARKYHCS